MTHLPSDQLGFDALLRDAESDNRAREFERETDHLPDTMEAGVPYYRMLIRHHHAAMLAADVDEAIRLREESCKLALRLNGGEPGILADDDSSGNVLARQTAAAPGIIPLWGQEGEFVITVGAMRVRIEINGIFGLAARFIYWPSFAAHAVDVEKPFLSATGYRSFFGMSADPVRGLQPDEFARKVIAAYVARDLKGKLVAIEPRYRERAAS